MPCPPHPFPPPSETLHKLPLLALNVFAEWPLTVPLLHVLLQGAVDTEGHVANLTLVHILAHLAVRLHVAREFAALGTGVAAQVALVWPLARVAPPVHRQVAAVLEDLQIRFN